MSSAERRMAPQVASRRTRALSDHPSRSAAGARGAPLRVSSRVRRAIREFLWLPTLVVVAYGGLGVVSSFLDTSTPSWLVGTRAALGHVIAKSAAASLLSAIATSVVTVTSITFSVLLLAVQQAASSMTPAVFDQFLRRRTNQLYLGMFVGLSLFAFIVLSSSGGNAVIGATIALVLTIVSFLLLIVLIYSTVDQMRPTSVTQVIHDHALQARRRELEILARTRREPEVQGDQRISVHSEQDGYLTDIDLDAITDALPSDAASEVRLEVALGDHVAFGQLLAVVVDDDDARRERVADGVRRSLRLDRERDLDVDGGFAVKQLANIAWTALSTAKHNPQSGRDAVDRLRDLALRWSQPAADEPQVERYAVIYRDTDLDEVLDALVACIVVCGESQQVDSCAHVVTALADVLEAVPAGDVKGIEPALGHTLAEIRVHPMTRPLERALKRLHSVLDGRSCPDAAGRVGELLDGLSHERFDGELSAAR